MNSQGFIFNIQRYCIHDGPGIRTTVFMKKCPLHCLWCANPEAINGLPEIFYYQNRCNKCYSCLDACIHGAISVPRYGEFIIIDRNICEGCEDHVCITSCDQVALELAGSLISVEELMEEVEKDDIFYRNSDGGVTLSGGEPTSQLGFTLELLKRCKEKGFHTTLDTCGYASWNLMKEILEYTDLILYDIKHMDSSKHKELTGVPNELILRNVEAIFAQARIPTIIRIPIIPQHNDSKDNMEATARYLKEIGATEVNLLPYHRLGLEKYRRLGRSYLLGRDIQPPNENYLKDIETIFTSHGLNCLRI